MKKIILILLFMPIVGYAQNPVIDNSFASLNKSLKEHLATDAQLHRLYERLIKQYNELDDMYNDQLHRSGAMYRIINELDVTGKYNDTTHMYIDGDTSKIGGIGYQFNEFKFNKYEEYTKQGRAKRLAEAIKRNRE